MKARAIEPLMGDLFDPLGRAPAGRAPAGRAPAPPTPRPKAQPPPQPPLAPPPLPRRSAALWRAVVFPHLSEQSLTLERLGRIAQQFTSFVSLEPPNALLLEVRGSVRLFGSLERLQDEIDGAWRRLELEASSATAPSTLAALWLARGAVQVTLEERGALAGALGALPLRVTAWDEEVLHTLRSMGVTRLGELLRLPRAGLARRFGRSLVGDLEVALARQGAPRRHFVPLERFRERRDFESEIETVDRLLALLAPMIERCALFLCSRQAGVQALELRLKYREHPPRHIRLGLASITSARARLEDTVMHTLLRLELEAPVRSVELRSGPLEPLSAGSLDVFRTSRAGAGGDTAPQLIERLRARLGARSVYGVRTIAEHRPEAAWKRHEALDPDRSMTAGAAPARAASSARRSIARAAAGMSRPVWLLDRPFKLIESDPPCSSRGALTLEEGPERIESGWWSGADVTRDYYRAREPGGAQLWVFKELKSGRWYLHGVFA